MRILRSPAPVLDIPHPGIRQLVAQRFADISQNQAFDPDIMGYMIVVEAGDTVEMLEKQSGCPLLYDPFDDVRYGSSGFTPPFDVLEEHDGCYEMLFIGNDDGFGITFFIPKAEGIPGDLLAMCARYATPAKAVT